ncbi:PAS domain S-box protein [Natrinema marinum]|uniref:PAS domain S-box protein n=1 Tax=Natrinema marinum TaxID=2961598 RepID=UPI0020C8F770|nr:PAS domain S-box protein [Natrinema marinum]
MGPSSPRDPTHGAWLRQQQVVADLSQQALETDDLEELYRDATAAVAETLGTEYAAVFELLPGGAESVLRAGVGWSEGSIGVATVPMDARSQPGCALRTSEPAVVDDLLDDGGAAEIVADHGITSGVSVRIGSEDDPWGVLGAYASEREGVSERDAAFVARVAEILESAIEQNGARGDPEEVYGRITDAFVALDEEWRFTYLNERAQELINPDGRRLVGARIWEEFPATLGRKFKPKCEQAIADGETVSFEEYYPEPLEAWFEVRAYPSETGLSVYFRNVTERKERERELRESEKRLRLALEAGEMGTWELDLQTRDSSVRSPQHDRIFGYDDPLDEWGFETFIGHVHADDREEVKRRFEEAFETGEWDFECRILRTDGVQRVISARGEFHFDGEGEPTRAVGVVQDVTERKQRERELEESEQRYRTIAEHVPNGLVTLFDHDFQYTLAAGQGFDRLPVEPRDLEGKAFDDVWPAETAAELRPAFEAALAGDERSVELEYAGREWLLHAVPITDERGDVFAGMTMAQDITEQKERERYFRDAKSQLEAATEAGAVGTWEWDIRTDEIVVGPSFARTFGVDPEAAHRGVSLDRFIDAIHEDDRERVVTAIEDAVDRCGEYECEYRVWNADGDLRWVVARGRVECADDGEPLTFPGALTDITERKEAELERRRTTEQLETLVGILPVGVVVADADGSLVRANDTAKEIWGGDVFDAESVAEYDKYPAVWAETGEPVAPEDWTMSQVLRGAEVTEPNVYEISAFDGEQRIIMEHGMPVRDEYGDVSRAVVTLSDITERREYQRKLAESERRYRTLVEHFPNGAVGLFDEDLRYRIAGGSAFDELSDGPEAVIGETLWDRYPPELAERFEPKFEAALAGETETFEVSFHDREWLAHTVPVTDDDGEIFAGMVMVQEITERKERERKLRERERRLEEYKEYVDDILDAIDDVFYVIGADGGLQRWNESLCEVTGYTDAEITEMEPLDFFAEDDRAAVTERIGEAFETGSATIELDLLTKDGTAIPFEFAASALEDPQGNAVLAGIGRDVTDRVERERHLERYETIVEEVNDGVYVVDGDGQFTMVNETYAEMLGYEPDELVGTDASVVVDDAVIERLRELEAAAAEGEIDWPTIEAAVETADGERVPAEATFSMLPDDDSGWYRVGIVRNISERKARERQLEESERRYRTLVENFPEGSVALFDDDLTYTAVGGQLLEEVGVDADDRVGTTVYEIYPDRLVEECESYFHAALEGESNSFDLELYDRHLYAHTLPVRNADDEIFAGMIVVQDVTERREYQRKLEESNERLEQFAYAASHDLQEPLRMVTSYLQLLEKRYGDAFDEDGEEFLEYAVDGAERMRQMIDALLEYSRIETRGDPFEPTDLNAVVDDVLADLQLQIEETDAEIVVADLPRVEGDANQLRQVFQNLLGNAVTYSADEPPRIHVSADRRDGEYVISVDDEGIGIAQDDQDRVFTIFDRLHSREEYDGMGIGLALCERIVERHGGEIWVDSEPGEGSTFSFTLAVPGDGEE